MSNDIRYRTQNRATDEAPSSVVPFGLLFAESNNSVPTLAGLSLRYSERRDCTLIVNGDDEYPFVRSGLALEATVTLPKGNDDEDEDSFLPQILLTLTSTKADPDPPLDDDASISTEYAW